MKRLAILLLAVLVSVPAFAQMKNENLGKKYGN